MIPLMPSVATTSSKPSHRETFLEFTGGDILASTHQLKTELAETRARLTQVERDRTVLSYKLNRIVASHKQATDALGYMDPKNPVPNYVWNQTKQ